LLRRLNPSEERDDDRHRNLKMNPGARATRELAGAVLRTQPDSRLVWLAREGHDAAIEEIVRRYRPALVAFAAGIVPRHRAEDVVQESLARAWKALDGSGAEIALRPWLYTIVRNRALNDLRDEPIHDPVDENLDGVPQPPEVAARRAGIASLVVGMKGLPHAQREALVKRELEGRSHEEIAAALGTSVGAVRQLIFRACTALRDAAGALVPAPVLRFLLGGDSTGVAAAGMGGAGIALKAAGVIGFGALAVGGGIALHHRSAPRGAVAVETARAAPGHVKAPRRASAAPVRTPVDPTASGDPRSGEGSSGGGGPSSGPGSGDTSGPAGDPSGSGPGAASGESFVTQPSESGDDGGSGGSGSDDRGGGQSDQGPSGSGSDDGGVQSSAGEDSSGSGGDSGSGDSGSGGDSTSGGTGSGTSGGTGSGDSGSGDDGAGGGGDLLAGGD
jgi:RNA polymerase sigma factor (sigma-70 family)